MIGHLYGDDLTPCTNLSLGCKGRRDHDFPTLDLFDPRPKVERDTEGGRLQIVHMKRGGDKAKGRLRIH